MNNAGLYSHFFQVKYMYHLASMWNRDLVILPYESIHTKDVKSINLCEIFEWQLLKIQCESSSKTKRIEVINYVSVEVNAPSNNPFKKCLRSLRPGKNYRKVQHLCFKGLVWGPSTVIQQQDKMEIMQYEPRLVFQETYQDLFNRISTTYTSFIQTKLDLELALLNSTVTSSAEARAELSRRVETVVHWRRGDQLKSRCSHMWKGLKDVSVNCATPVHLVQSVQSHLSSISPTGSSPNSTNPTTSPVQEWRRPVLVATNEANETILDELRAYRFYPIVDLLRHYCDLHATVHPNGTRDSCNGTTGMTSMEEFIVESQFMTSAPIFISYGISQVNDVIEYERMQGGKSWCSQSEREAVEEGGGNKERKGHDSWCGEMKSKGRGKPPQTQTLDL